MQRNRDPFRLVITGGPCAGKTDLWRFLGAAFPAAIPVPEAATQLILAGKSEETLGLESFQRAVFQRQWALEEEALGRGLFLLCDRGLLDGLAYLPDLFFFLKVSREEVMNRYAMVLQLEVIRDPRAYGVYCKNNPARREEHARALALERAVGRIYERHPAYVFLAGSLKAKRQEGLRVVRERLAEKRPDLLCCPHGSVNHARPSRPMSHSPPVAPAAKPEREGRARRKTRG